MTHKDPESILLKGKDVSDLWDHKNLAIPGKEHHLENRGPKRTFHTKMGTIKDRMVRTEEEDIKKR